ncbi:MAG: biopolymer transporter ExbB [Pseudomonadota bacterium]
MSERKPAPQFSQPVGQITTMLIVLGLVGGGLYLGRDTILSIFWSNPLLNGLISGVFVLGVLLCFRQVIQLMYSVQWIEGFAAERTGHHLTTAPSLLAPLATLLRSRGARSQLSSSSGRSILESVGQRIDEVREITRYIGNTLIFLGLLGTFYGLATTVPALVETIRSLSPDEGQSGADIFNRLQAGLESQLGGMGTAFSSSLLGLAGSLVVGLLELFVTQGQNRFYQELEEWLSTITRISVTGGDDSDGGSANGVIEHLAEQLENMTVMFAQSDASRASVDEKLGKLAVAMETMAFGQDRDSGQSALLQRIAEGQERLIKSLEDGGVDGLDAESRMRLRSIDVQLLRVLEEMSAGRQETMSEIRSDIAALSRALKSSRGDMSGGY